MKKILTIMLVVAMIFLSTSSGYAISFDLSNSNYMGDTIEVDGVQVTSTPISIVSPSGLVELNALIIHASSNTVPDEHITYPSCVQTGETSWYYNCHSYAWFYGGNMSGVTDYIWINSPFAYHSSNSCVTLVNPSGSVSYSELCNVDIRVDDIIVYYHYNSSSNVTESHSAIVRSVGSSVDSIIVESKWGYFETYQHKIPDCLYYSYGDINGNAAFSEFYVYRPAHSYDQTIFPSETSADVYSDYSEFLYKSCGASGHKQICGACGRGYTSTVLAHNMQKISQTVYKCTQCPYREITNISINSSSNNHPN